ncbi:hypothetical protein ALC56_12326 [Trachymyrmex septentrionalis]|uniref:Uncharacterized protein n=1 Tax=Trachymyrmex septentrionalis TaxID=34720 RepID=A0A195F0H0_9HYME|nr:hypothetical protein ALC56_12326 [Trachymyrmex septentrionalis]
MCGLCVPTHTAHRKHTDALLVYFRYTDEFQETYLVERSREAAAAAAAAAAVADAINVEFCGTRIARDLPLARYCTLQFGGALSRTPTPPCESEFHRHLSHGIIGKRASSLEKGR